MRLFRSKKSNDNEYDFQLDDDAVEQINSEFSDDEIIDVKPKHRLRRFIIRFSLLCVIVIMINIAVLFFTGKLWFNQPDKNDYPVRGALIDSGYGENPLGCVFKAKYQCSIYPSYQGNVF